MKNLSVLSVALLCASMATAAENSIYTGTFFDDNGAYFGPDCEKDGTQSTGAYYTGDYTSPFKTFLGKTDKDIQDKLDELWNHYFGGQNDKTVYYEDNDGGYIVDINNNDIRSEGMSYGMMISVQTNHREQFDKLWKWAKKHMWKDPATGGSGYFAWQANRDGSVRDWGNAPDGEIYFMMSLLFAAHRWDDAQYMKDAQSILKACWKGNGQSLYSEQSYIATFQPSDGNNTWGDASYSLPAFVDMFSRWSDTNKDKWLKATKATRDHIYNSANRDIFERYLLEITEYVATAFVDNLIAGRPVPPEDRIAVIQGYKCELFGHIVDWLGRGMNHDLEKQFLRLCELRRGMTEEMLRRSLGE